MKLIEIFFFISWIVILISSYDVAKRKKFNALHFLVFIAFWAWLLLFTVFPNIISYIWNLFWIQRWIDVFVYSSIIFLVYFVLILLRKVEINKENITNIIRWNAINNSSKKKIFWEEVFIIPVYNEWTVVSKVIKEIFDNNYKNIILINDWSDDNTIDKLKKYWNNLILLNHDINRGQWAAIETWFEYVRRYSEANYVITFDSDGQHSIEDVKKFKKIIKENKNVDVFLWSRFLRESRSNISFHKIIILRLWILFTFFLSKIHLTDTHNWFRVIKAKTLNKIKITIDWMWHASEIIDIIAKENIMYKEVPVHIKYTEYSIKKWQKWINAINIALRMIWNKFFK